VGDAYASYACPSVFLACSLFLHYLAGSVEDRSLWRDTIDRVGRRAVASVDTQEDRERRRCDSTTVSVD